VLLRQVFCARAGTAAADTWFRGVGERRTGELERVGSGERVRLRRGQ
jgi:hypothetical protein